MLKNGLTRALVLATGLLSVIVAMQQQQPQAALPTTIRQAVRDLVLSSRPMVLARRCAAPTLSPHPCSSLRWRARCSSAGPDGCTFQACRCRYRRRWAGSRQRHPYGARTSRGWKRRGSKGGTLQEMWVDTAVAEAVELWPHLVVCAVGCLGDTSCKHLYTALEFFTLCID